MINISHVLSLNNFTWSKMLGVDVLSVTGLSGSSRNDNVSLILNNDSEIKIFPGWSPDSEEDAVLRTKKYFIPNQNQNGDILKVKVKKIQLVFTGSPTVTVRVYNEKFTSGYEDEVITDLESGIWRGLPGGLKGYYFDFKITNAETVEYLQAELVIYNEGAN